MKKTLCILLVFALAVGFVAAQDAAPVGVQPIVVQAAFYTPTYQCIYLKSVDEVGGSIEANKWNTYSTKIDKNAITYDGMSGKRSGYNVIRVKSNTKKSGEEVVLYVDNVKLVDGSGKTILLLDFEDGDSAAVYVSQGRKVAKDSEPAEAVEFDGRKCFLMHMKSQSLYGSIGLEVQWPLPENESDPKKTWDFTKGDYTVSFDFYIAAAK